MNVRHSTTSVWTLTVVLFAILYAVTIPSAHSGKKPSRMIFSLVEVEVPKTAPPELKSLIQNEFHALLNAQATLLDSIPADAPAMDSTDTDRRGNKAFRKYMKKHKLRPFRVTLQVTKYKTTQKPNPKKSGKIVETEIAIHMFGETLPFRTMAFTGDGSATVLIEVGNKVRDKDRKFADVDAVEFALTQAIAASLKKLEQPVKKKTRKRPRR